MSDVETFRARLNAMPDVQPTARDEIVDELVDEGHTAADFDKALASMRIDKPHRFLDLAAQELRTKVLAGNLTAAGQYHKLYGQAVLDALRAEKREAESTGPKKVSDRSNPWLKQNWNATAQSRLVASIGLERASQIAKAAGCVVGSTKPNPAFN